MLWLATGLLALATAGTAPVVPPLVAAIAVVLVLTGPGGSTAARLALAVSYLPAAFAGQAPTAAWLAAGVLMSIATRSPRPAGSGETELLRHLERARRRGEPASVMVLRLPSAGRRAARELQRRLRAADSVRTVRGVAANEIHAVMDGGDLEAGAVEARLGTDEISGASVGWARFPRDGGSLEVLLATARERATEEQAAPAEATERPAAQFTPSMVKAD
jgi:hypothetical protein